MTPEATRLAAATVQVAIAWVEFRKSHDVESAKLSCCDKSKKLFDALEVFENLLRHD